MTPFDNLPYAGNNSSDHLRLLVGLAKDMVTQLGKIDERLRTVEAIMHDEAQQKAVAAERVKELDLEVAANSKRQTEFHEEFSKQFLDNLLKSNYFNPPAGTERGVASVLNSKPDYEKEKGLRTFQYGTRIVSLDEYIAEIERENSSLQCDIAGLQRDIAQLLDQITYHKKDTASLNGEIWNLEQETERQAAVIERLENHHRIMKLANEQQEVLINRLQSIIDHIVERE